MGRRSSSPPPHSALKKALEAGLGAFWPSTDKTSVEFVNGTPRRTGKMPLSISLWQLSDAQAKLEDSTSTYGRPAIYGTPFFKQTDWLFCDALCSALVCMPSLA